MLNLDADWMPPSNRHSPQVREGKESTIKFYNQTSTNLI